MSRGPSGCLHLLLGVRLDDLSPTTGSMYVQFVSDPVAPDYAVIRSFEMRTEIHRCGRSAVPDSPTG